MRKKLLSVCLLGALTSLLFEKSFGQQTVMYTQYMFNGLAINPAYAGSDKYLNVTLQARQQWMGFKGSPTSQMFSAHKPLPNKKMGLGILLERESMGVNETFNAYIMYAYKIRLQKGTLSMGLQAGVSNYRQQLTDLTVPDGVTDPSFSDNVSYTLPNVGAGVYYSTTRFYAGFSSPFLLQNTFDKSNPVLSAKQSRNYFLSSGYVFDLNSSLKLKPNFLVKFVNGAPVNVDINVNLLIKEVIWVGCSFRANNSVNPLLEILLNQKLRIGFAYDLPVSAMARAYSGSPEVMLNYRFVRNEPSRVISPRYF
jgi:type IX secretion system PorP/SprF family membrane protein